MAARLRYSFALAALLSLVSAALPSCLLTDSAGTDVRLLIDAPVGAATSADGVEVRLDDLFLHVELAELVACDDSTEATRGIGWGPSTARAHHGTAQGTLLSTRHLVALRGPTSDLGRFRPPPGRYCEVHLELSPAVSGTEGVSDDGLGWTLWGHGSVGGPPREVYAFGVLHWELPLEAPITLDEARLFATLTVAIDLGAAIEDVDASDAELFGGELLRALPGRTTVRETPTE